MAELVGLYFERNESNKISKSFIRPFNFPDKISSFFFYFKNNENVTDIL